MKNNFVMNFRGKNSTLLIFTGIYRGFTGIYAYRGFKITGIAGNRGSL